MENRNSQFAGDLIEKKPTVHGMARRSAIVGSRMLNHDHLFIFVVMAPMVLFFATFFYYPILKNIYLIFFDYDYLHPPTYIGLANLERFFHDPVVLKVFLNTITVTIVSVPLLIVLSLVVSVGVYRLRIAQTAIRSIIFSTFLTTWIVAGITFKFLFNPELGFVNAFLHRLGIGAVPWLTDPFWAMAAAIMLGIWKFLGYFMVIFLAALYNVDPQLYEAAKIDGANSLQQFFYVTIPAIKPAMVFVSIVAVINYLRFYQQILILTGGGPYRSTETILMYMFDLGIKSRDVGYASTISLALFVVIFLASQIQIRVTKAYSN